MLKNGLHLAIAALLMQTAAASFAQSDEDTGRKAAEEFGLDISGFTLINTPHSHASAEIAATMAAVVSVAAS